MEQRRSRKRKDGARKRKDGEVLKDNNDQPNAKVASKSNGKRHSLSKVKKASIKGASSQPSPNLRTNIQQGLVIGGLSLRLPESDNCEEFWDNLIQGKDMVTDAPRNWDPKALGVPTGVGKLKPSSLEKFDSQFFEVHPKQTEKLDPQVRLLLEVAYEAMVDACFNPKELAGSRTGVFIGACGSDFMTNNASTNNLDKLTGYENTGCALSMFANRISFHFDLKGPSLCVDTACSSSLTAFHFACKAIESGECDHALVGGSNFVFHPLWSIGFAKLSMTSDRCRSFSQDGKGFARAEGAVVVMISRESLARKKYARVLAAEVSCDGYTKEGITFPHAPAHHSLLRQVYAGHPDWLARLHYVEAHGTGTAAGDPVELNSIEAVLFEQLGRKVPVHIGSVKSNMGHGEAASGLAGIAKVLLSMLHGQIPSNLHAQNFNQSIPGLWNGHLQVVKEHTPFPEGLAAISSFGFGGSNAHVLIEKLDSPMPSAAELYPIPFSARTEAGFEALEAEISKNFAQANAQLSMVNHQPLGKNPHRGFVVFDKSGQQLARVKATVAAPGESRPLWLVMNGVGAQWAGMGASLLQIPVAREWVQKCHAHLQKHKLDLMRILLNTEDKKIFSTPVDIFVGVASVQLALYEALRAMDLQVDGFFGHSLGELLCAYVDGTVSFEQTLDIAYFRGLALVQSAISGGAMMAVEMTLEALQKVLPSDLEIACHNSTESYTLSGPQDAIKVFASTLKQLDVTHKVLDTGGIPFHSSHIGKARPLFTKYLTKILKHPKARSPKWLSSSRHSSSEAGAKGDLADVQFFTQNLFESVHFSRCMMQVPPNAVLLEVGPHGLFKSQFSTNLPGADHVFLSKRKDQSCSSFWKGIGELCCHGVALNLTQFLHGPKFRPDFPLPRLSSLVSWDHSATWTLPEVNLAKSAAKSDYIEDFAIDIQSPEYAFAKDHIVNSNPIYPGMGYLHLVWLTLAKFAKADPETVAVELTDIRFVRASIFRSSTTIRLTVKYDTVEKSFQVLEGDQLVAKGTVSAVGGIAMGMLDLEPEDVELLTKEWSPEGQAAGMQRNDVYKLFVKTGIEYRNAFRGIRCLNAKRNAALVDWIDHWTPHFDSVLQLFMVAASASPDGFGLPKSLDLFRFDPTKARKEAAMPCVIKVASGALHTPCLDLEGLRTTPFAAAVEDYVMCAISFQPYEEATAFPPDTQAYFDLCRELVLDNLHRIIHREDLSKFAHLDLSFLPKIEAGLGPLQPHPYSQAAVDQASLPPNAHLLRFLAHVFANWRELLVDAMPVILASPDHKAQYRADKVCWRNPQVLENMLELVVRNSPASQTIRCVEVGAGTGSMSCVAVPYMCKYSAEYTMSDISSGFFPALRTEFAAFGEKTRYMVWDANLPLEHQAHYDLILGSNSVHTVRHLGKTLGHVAAALKEGGFFLVHEFASNFWYPVGVWGFIRDYWAVDDPRTVGMHVDEEGWAKFGRTAGLELVMARRLGDMQSYLLFRKVALPRPSAPVPMEDSAAGSSVAAAADPGVSTLVLPDITTQSNFLELQASLEAVPAGQRVWLVAHEDVVPGLDGFVRTMGVEVGHIHVRGLLIAHGEQDPPREEVLRMQRLDLMSNVWKHGRMGAYMRTNWENLTPTPTPTPSGELRVAGAKDSENFQICVTVPGDLNSTKLVPVDPAALALTNVPDAEPGFNPAVVRVHYVALNFKDAMLASGRISSANARPTFGEAVGMEFAGEVEEVAEGSGGDAGQQLKKGTRVMGMREMGVAGRVRVERELNVWRVPEWMSLEEAATVPVAYATAAMALVVKARTRPGQSVLIHSGAGAVGQAAICLALRSLGLEVFTTVSSHEKRDMLLRRFPELKPDRVVDSRTMGGLGFRNAVLERTGGRGVDVVLNSFSGEKLWRSVEVVARHGQVVDISRYDAFHNSALPMRGFLKNLSYTSFYLDELFADRHPDAAVVHRYLQEALDQRRITPLLLSGSSDLVASLALLLKGNTVGKIVVDLPKAQLTLTHRQSPVPVPGPAPVQQSPANAHALNQLRVFTCNAAKAYVVTGGLGGIGLELCEWLASRGARDLVINTRSTVLSPLQQLVVSNLRARGVRVEVSNLDLTQSAAAAELCGGLERAGRAVGAVFHLAMVLRDRILSNLSFEDWTVPIQVKIGIGRNLDGATRALCPQLEHFVMFSSVLSFYGNMGQSNYALGNSGLERLVERRRAEGLPGVAIQVGAVGDVGFLSAEGRGGMVSRLGMEPMKSTSFIHSLDQLLLGGAAVVSSHAALRFKHGAEDTGGRGGRDKNLVQDVLAIMGFQQPPAKEMHSKSLVELGVDSLMVVEINQVLSRDYNIRLSPKQIRQLTLEKISEMAGAATPATASASASASDSATANGTAAHSAAEGNGGGVLCESIYSPMPSAQFKSAYYYIDGIFLDPAANLPLIVKQSRQSRSEDAAGYFYVPYHSGAPEVEALVQSFLSHLLALPATVGTVTLCGFSFGAVLAALLGARAKADPRLHLPKVSFQLQLQAFAIPKGFVEILDKSLAVVQTMASEKGSGATILNAAEAIAFLERHKDDERIIGQAISTLRGVFGDYEDGHVVEYSQMLSSVKFLQRNREALQAVLAGGEAGSEAQRVFDVVYAFEQDALSMSRDQSLAFCAPTGVLQKVQRKHSPHSVTF